VAAALVVGLLRRSLQKVHVPVVGT
jgi:hypothetical protein